MRKAILCVVMALAVTGMASAVPPADGPGGTIYWQSWDRTNALMRFYYLDVNADWTAIGSVAEYTTVAIDQAAEAARYTGTGNSNSGVNGPFSFMNILPNADTGKQDMGGSYHSASLFQELYYNTDAYGTYNSGTVRGADFLKITQTGTNTASITILNNGINGTAVEAGNAAETSNKEAYAIVDSHNTANGEAYGVITQGLYNYNCWTGDFQTTNGVVNQSSGTALNLPSRTYSTQSAQHQDMIISCGLNGDYTIGGVAVKGAIIEYDKQYRGPDQGPGGVISDPNTGSFVIAYKKKDSDGYIVVDFSATSTSTTMTRKVQDAYNMIGAVGDTDGNGIPDFYYYDSVLPSTIAHAEDADGDGMWLGAAESELTTMVWATGNGVHGNVYLVQTSTDTTGGFAGGHWALLSYGQPTSGAARLKVFGLGADGLGDGTSYDIMVSTTDGSLMLPSTNGSSTSATPPAQNMNTNFVFVPLGTAVDNEVPEPATLMLVGSGVLGLAGVLRRRMIS